MSEYCGADMPEATLTIARGLCVSAVPRLNDSRQPEVLAAIIVMMVLAIAAVVLRLIARRLSAARLGIDDFLILVALVHSLQSLSPLISDKS